MAITTIIIVTAIAAEFAYALEVPAARSYMLVIHIVVRDKLNNQTANRLLNNSARDAVKAEKREISVKITNHIG